MTLYTVRTDKEWVAAIAKMVPGVDTLIPRGVFSPKVITKSNIDIYAKYATIKGGPTSDKGLLVIGDDVTISGLSVTQVGKGSGISVTGNNVTLSNVKSYDNSGHGLWLSGVGGYVVNGLFEGNAAGSDRYHAYSGVSIQSKAGGITSLHNNTVRDNVNERGKHTDGFGIIVDKASGPVEIVKNTITANGHAGIGVVKSSNVLIEDNFIYKNATDPAKQHQRLGEIYMFEATNVDIQSNSIVADAGKYSIMATGASKVVAEYMDNFLYTMGRPGWGSYYAQDNRHHDMPSASDNHLGVVSPDLDWIL